MVTVTDMERVPRFRVLDAMDAPYEGRILRLRLETGATPAIADLKGARLTATSSDGDAGVLYVRAFAVFGGRTSDERLARSGRIDVVVEPEGRNLPVGPRWEVRLEP